MKVTTHVGLLLLMIGMLAIGLSGCADETVASPGGGDGDGDGDLDGDTGEEDTNPVTTDDTGGGGGGTTSLMPSTEGWLDQTDDGFQGAWYTYTDNDDGGNSTIVPAEGDPFTNDGSELCVSGEASLVVDEEWSTYWGAGVGMDLCANTADQDPPEKKYTLSTCPFNADLANQFLGVEFDIDGTWGDELRCSFKEADRIESAYVEITSSGHQECLVEEAQVWYDTEQDLTDVTKIEALQFQIATNATSATAFEFCISNLKAVMAK